MEPLLISIGGGVGAVFRYSVGLLIGRHSFPWATLVVNGLGSFILNLLAVVLLFACRNYAWTSVAYTLCIGRVDSNGITIVLTVRNDTAESIALNPTVTGAEEFFDEETVMNPGQQDILVRPGATSDVTIYLENLDKYLEMEPYVGDLVEALEGRYTDFKWWRA